MDLIEKIDVAHHQTLIRELKKLPNQGAQETRSSGTQEEEGTIIYRTDRDNKK